MSTLATGTKRRVIDVLKRRDATTAGELAEVLGVTEAAVRQHLADLEDRGLVERGDGIVDGPGRPRTAWRLTALAGDLFPDRHGDLTVALLDSIRSALGNEGLDRVIDARTQTQLTAYREVVPAPDAATLRERAEALARLRSDEGYLAEITDDPDVDGALLLVEHHCPICDAAAACQSLCRSELDVFRDVLGPDVEVERTTHLLADDHRCTYRIRPT